MEKRSLYTVVLVMSLAGYGWLGWNFLNGHERNPPTVCLVKAVTGIPCPSCGTTRALTGLVHGHIAESLLVNPFGLVLAGGLIVFPLWVSFDLLRRKDGFFRFFLSVERTFSQHTWIRLMGSSFIVLNWIWNITKGL